MSVLASPKIIRSFAISVVIICDRIINDVASVVSEENFPAGIITLYLKEKFVKQTITKVMLITVLISAEDAGADTAVIFFTSESCIFGVCSVVKAIAIARNLQV